MGFLQAVILQCFERCICFFCRMGNTSFPPSVRSSLLPNLDIIGVPIGDYLHCTRFISEKISQAKALLAALVEVAAADLHVATSLLRISFCKLHCATSWIYDSVYSVYMLNIHTNIHMLYAKNTHWYILRIEPESHVVYFAYTRYYHVCLLWVC